MYKYIKNKKKIMITDTNNKNKKHSINKTNLIFKAKIKSLKKSL